MVEGLASHSEPRQFQYDDDDYDVDEYNDYDDGDNLRSRKWKAPPVDYYRCGKCVCYNSENGLTLHADCQYLLLRQIPDYLSENITDLNLYHNHVSLEFDRLLRYVSLRVLNVSSNAIKELPSCTYINGISLHTLDLSDNLIRTISNNSFLCLPNLRTLYLQKNYIQTVTSLMFTGLNRLQRLDLSQNYLSTIEHNAFNNCRGLKMLNLGNNKNMTYGVKQFNSTIFKPLKQLETFYIQGFISSVGYVYPTAVLLELTNLRELSIDGVGMGRFESNLTALKDMTVLNIGVDGHCAIKVLTEDYFIGFPNLKSVHLFGCKPTKISPLAFAANKLLIHLRYTKTAYVFEELFNSLYGLQNSTLKSLSINLVTKYAKRTACRQLCIDHVKYIKNMHHLEELNLENNLVSLIQYDFLINLPVSLKKLNVRKNTLHYLRTVIKNPATGRLVNLVEIKEDMQSNVVFFEDSGNSLETEEDDVNSQEVVHPAMSKPATCPSSQDNNQPETVQAILPPNLQIYSASQSFHFGEILISRSTVINKLRYFDISNSYITDWGSKLLPEHIEVADFSENFCDSLKVSFFRPNNSLKELHAAGNFLGESFANDIRGEILSRLHQLRYLDLSRNHIQDLPHPFLTGLTNVQVINLSGNNIHSVSLNISSLNKLRFLNVSRNSISWFSRQSLDDLDRINTRHQVSLDLTSNPLPCTCSGLPFIQWLANTKVRILSKDFLTCVNDVNELEPVGDLDARFLSLQKKCVSKVVLILIISFSIAFVFVIALAVWIFRNRWRLHYLRNIAIARLFGFPHRNADEDKQYAYDVHILYSKEDKAFVLGDCLRELEIKRNHKLCVEDRDFLLGTFMTCTITSAVCSSRWTIPLISPDFWANEWGEYGVQMAAMESIHAHRNVLHFLIYKPTPVETMPRSLIKLLKENTFCEYPPDGCDENVKEAFWDELSRTIGHIRQQDIVDGNC
ncbi:unnamed protein product [Candidula unifasciata]|uniref:TIR domain-containing protein n=1 Tax=Candidula unifasciata TaxID=100452 RepID=A0A8S4A6K4_9EUPU|nr:unnamed protein product [Candidula unifasciata]